MFNEYILSNHSPFQPKHYLEDTYALIFVLMYTLQLLGLQLL